MMASKPETENFQIKARDRRHVDFRQQEDSKEANKWAGPFFFVQAADCQFGLIDAYLKELPEPGWAEEIELSEAFVRACNKMEPTPKFIVVCGDLVNAFVDKQVRADQIVDFKRIFSKIRPDIPLVCVCGNHDVGDVPTMGSIADYRQEYGDDYFHFVVNGCLFIVINSQFYENRDNVKDYAHEQDEWIMNQLSRCKDYKYTIVFEHIPWFLLSPDEDDDYFNINRSVRLEWLKRFKEAGVNKIMCGHYHRNAGGWDGDMELVVTSAIGAQLGQDKSGARIVKVLDDKVYHEYFAMEELPTKIELA